MCLSSGLDQAQAHKELVWHKIFDDFIDKLEDGLSDDVLLLGTISSFAKVPPDQRQEILERHKDFIVFAFAEPVGRLLTLYPDCPALWLLPEDWKQNVQVDYQFELNKLEQALVRLYPAKDDYCGYLRMMPLIRIAKRGKIHFAIESEIPDLLVKYPSQCTDEEKALAESYGRTLVNQYLTPEPEDKDWPEWPKYFWRHNYDLSICRYPQINFESIDEEADKLFWNRVNETRQTNVKCLQEFLDEIVLKLKIDLYDPDKDEVVLGLFSRIVRLYTVLLEDSQLWAQDLSRIMLRCLVDTSITLCYLLKSKDEKLYKDFIEYGKGKEKLLMLHLQDTHSEDTGPSGEDTESLASGLGGGLMPEVINIDLAFWTKKSARDMANDVGMMKFYRLIYDPTSSDIHGTWVSIKNINLIRCVNPLHRFHRLPHKFAIPLFITPLVYATEIMKKVIEFCRDNYSFPPLNKDLYDFSEFEGEQEKKDE